MNDPVILICESCGHEYRRSQGSIRDTFQPDGCDHWYSTPEVVYSLHEGHTCGQQAPSDWTGTADYEALIAKGLR